MSLKRNTFAEAKPLTNLLDAVQRLPVLKSLWPTFDSRYEAQLQVLELVADPAMTLQERAVLPLHVSSDERLVLNCQANYGCLKLVITTLSWL